MSISADEVLDEGTLARLGEPVEEKPADHPPVPHENEIRQYDDGITTITGPSYNMAKDLSVAMDISQGLRPEDLNSDLVLNWVKAKLVGSGENPVYVRSETLDMLGMDDKAAVYVRFQGDDTAYPARLRNGDILSRHLEENDDLKLDREVRRELEAHLQEDRFLVPVLKYLSDDELVREHPSVIAWQEGNEIVALEDDERLKRYRDEEIGNPHDIHAQVVRQDDEGDPERMVLDLSRFEYDEVNVETVESGLAVAVDGEIVYTNNRFNKAFVQGRELPNGLYEIYTE